ncbi:response regulator transcription factor [Anaerocolumna xylanovorans]|uniref:Stage 0 sporulation protein A homolog n=1 Tax=Anaerocolumna xylanovorans DSM 12503 TaxID=1121345 RepID=A0A1M7YFZ4_9FIRM|nr:response regulator [Anaerocolumna xylanovorans]SHO51506.1 two-component system, response regulator YesN [Anaerocolumna xylanovorans DSM 12503]
MTLVKAVIIDDETWTRKVIRQLGYWEEFGIRIVGEASDGEYGLELIHHMKPEIILVDVNMPLLNGLDLITALRGEGNDACVIFVSGYDNYEFVRSAMKLGALDYLLKPVKQEELNQLLRKCVHTLREKKDVRGENLIGSFLDTAWAGSYYKLRDSLADAMITSDMQVMRSILNDIYELIAKNESEPVPKGSMICIYYSMLGILQQFIMERQYDAKEIFEGKSTVFVFSKECSFEEMYSFLTDLYYTAYTRIQELIHTRNRIDIKQIIEYVKEHYTEGITLEQAAATFFISKEYLSKIFKTVAGKGFSEYVTSLRMERAKELIVSYKIPIKEVGEMLGYVDQAHFYKTFKKFYGRTPGELKEDNNIQ